MGKLVIDGNRVYTVDEACMRKKNLTLAQIRRLEAPQENMQKDDKEQKSRQ